MSNNRPLKGILKAPNHKKNTKPATFDEENVLATHHPVDKDYGHMKIDEPKTPYNYVEDELEKEFAPQLNSEELVKKLNEQPKQDLDQPRMTAKEAIKKKKFEDKRKMHYNMFDKIKQARELMKKEMEELEDS